MITTRIPLRRFFLTLALSTATLVSLTALRGLTQTEPPCQTPPSQGQITTWKQGETVNVMIDPTFSST